MKKNKRDISYPGIWLVSLALLGLGLLMILSSSSAVAYSKTGDIYFFFKRQLVGAFLGLFALYIFSRIDYLWWKRLSLLIILLSQVLLVFVLFFGKTAGGAQRWLGFGPFQFQPSEFAKLAILIFGAQVIAERRTGRGLGRFFPLLFFTASTALLVILQKDLGTAFVISVLSFCLLFIGGLEIKYCFSLATLGISAVFLLSYVEKYRWQRIEAFWNPWKYAKHAGYQIVQALYAFGTGGIFGVGLGQSRQKYFYLPAAHTDFIFAIIGEELGLIGTALVLLLFLALAYFVLRVSLRARDFYGKILSSGIGIWIIGQALLNMAVVTKTIPVTGLPLPLISYGGSSLVFTLAAIGILLNISQSGRRSEARSYWGRHSGSRISRSFRSFRSRAKISGS
jgi:cell division protein FtsW